MVVGEYLLGFSQLQASPGLHRTVVKSGNVRSEGKRNNLLIGRWHWWGDQWLWVTVLRCTFPQGCFVKSSTSSSPGPVPVLGVFCCGKLYLYIHSCLCDCNSENESKDSTHSSWLNFNFISNKLQMMVIRRGRETKNKRRRKVTERSWNVWSSLSAWNFRGSRCFQMAVTT